MPLNANYLDKLIYIYGKIGSDKYLHGYINFHLYIFIQVSNMNMLNIEENILLFFYMYLKCFPMTLNENLC